MMKTTLFNVDADGNVKSREASPDMFDVVEEFGSALTTKVVSRGSATVAVANPGNGWLLVLLRTERDVEPTPREFADWVRVVAD